MSVNSHRLQQPPQPITPTASRPSLDTVLSGRLPHHLLPAHLLKGPPLQYTAPLETHLRFLRLLLHENPCHPLPRNHLSSLPSPDPPFSHTCLTASQPVTSKPPPHLIMLATLNLTRRHPLPIQVRPRTLLRLNATAHGGLPRHRAHQLAV